MNIRDKYSYYRKILVSKLNAILITNLGKPLKLIQVVEYPKCGGSWIARLIRSYTGIDRKYGIASLVRPHAVIQTHTLVNTCYYKTIVVVRDPRDVWVSFYFHETHGSNGENIRGAINYRYNENESNNMFKYICEKLEYPQDSMPGFSYEKFVDAWRSQSRAHVVLYEDMQADPESTLAGIVDYLHLPIDPDRIKASIEQNTFFAVSGRQAGMEDKNSHKRKGIVGDWKNYFTPEIVEIVKQMQGNLLRKLNY